MMPLCVWNCKQARTINRFPVPLTMTFLDVTCKTATLFKHFENINFHFASIRKHLMFDWTLERYWWWGAWLTDKKRRCDLCIEIRIRISIFDGENDVTVAIAIFRLNRSNSCQFCEMSEARKGPTIANYKLTHQVNDCNVNQMKQLSFVIKMPFALLAWAISSVWSELWEIGKFWCARCLFGTDRINGVNWNGLQSKWTEYSLFAMTCHHHHHYHNHDWHSHTHTQPLAHTDTRTQPETK